VEDSIQDVYLVRTFLEKTDLFQVTTSQDGYHAARLIEEHAFDLVITDLNLPGKDGYDLIRLVKVTIPDVPVIATTVYTAPHYHEDATDPALTMWW
jgi:two-component system response regulator HydG